MNWRKSLEIRLYNAISKQSLTYIVNALIKTAIVLEFFPDFNLWNFKKCFQDGWFYIMKHEVGQGFNIYLRKINTVDENAPCQKAFAETMQYLDVDSK